MYDLSIASCNCATIEQENFTSIDRTSLDRDVQIDLYVRSRRPCTCTERAAGEFTWKRILKFHLLIYNFVSKVFVLASSNNRKGSFCIDGIALQSIVLPVANLKIERDTFVSFRSKVIESSTY